MNSHEEYLKVADNTGITGLFIILAINIKKHDFKPPFFYENSDKKHIGSS